VTAIGTTLAALAALVSLGTAPATAAEIEFRDTTIVGGQPNALKVHVSMQPRAKLTDTQTGAPLPGHRVEFWMNLGPLPAGGPICVAFTDAAGVAKCSVGVRDVMALIQVGYEARYNSTLVGDVMHRSSSDLVEFLGRQ
jgi:hypothetical protein